MSGDVVSGAGPATVPFWKRNPLYRGLRRLKRTIRSRIQAAGLGRRVEKGYRVLPEASFQACLLGAFQLLAETADGPLGDYLEFGVFFGASLACAYRATRALGLRNVRLFGFDSFAGLPPEAELPGEGPWSPGQFRSPMGLARRFLDRAGVDWKRTWLIKGWFKDTLIEETRRRYGLSKASVIMIDCDIYTSAKQALEFCGPLIKDRAVILFDDWNASDLGAKGMGERRAFEEFLAANPSLTAERLPSYFRKSEVFLVTRATA